MKRTIKFRGKCLDDGSWVYGYFIKYLTGRCFIHEPVISSASENDMYEYEIDPETVGQFTGFVDMAGQDVYEGDYMLTKGVLPSNKGEIYCCPLVYHKDALCHFVHEIGAYLRLNKENFDGDMMYTVVVGNIHDNPELQSGHTEEVKMLIKQIYGKYSRKCLFMSRKSDKKSDKKNLK